MSLKHFACILGLVVCVSGCSKVEPHNAAQEAAKQDWSQESVNHLLAYVPLNTPLIVASTHGFDAQTGLTEHAAKPVLNALMTQFSDIDIHMNESIQRKIDNSHEGDSTGKIALILKTRLDDIIQLMRNYPQYASEWGFQTNGHDDYIFYIYQSMPVLKFTTADAEVFKTHMHTKGVLSQLAATEVLGELLPIKEITIQDEPWTIYDMTPIVCFDYNKGRKQEFEPTCKKAMDEHHYAAAVAVHYGKDNIVTSALIVDDKDTVLPELLKPAAAPMTSAMYTHLSPDVHHFTHISPLPIIDLVYGKICQMVQSKVIVDEEFIQFFKPIRAWAGEYSSVDIKTHLNGSEVTVDSSFEVTDRETLKSIHAMTTGTRAFSSNIQAGIQISSPLEQTVDLLHKRAEHYFGDHRYLKRKAKDIAILKNYIKSIDGIDIELLNLNLGKDNIEFDGKVSLYGQDIHSLVTQAYSMMGSDQLPALNTPRPMQFIDTSEILSAPLNEILKESEYSIASSSYDLKANYTITEPNTVADIVLKTPILKTLFSQYNIFYNNRLFCNFINIEDETCYRLPSRFIELFDDKACIEVKFGSTESAETIQLKYNLALKP